MHVAGVNRDARTFEHVDPAEVGADRRVLVSELSGKGTVQARADVDGETASARDRAREGAREPRLPVRGGRRLLRPPDPQGDGRVRAAVPARVLARDRREARGRPSGDRGHDQDLGGRRALRANRRGERPRERARQGAARGDRRALPAPARHRARELQGAHPRRAQGHGRGHARAARRHRRPGHLGRDRRVREHHRGELGRARGLARGRHAARPHAALAVTRRGVTLPRRDPAGSPGHRAARGGARPRDASLRPPRPRPTARRVRVGLRRRARAPSTSPPSPPARPASTSRSARRASSPATTWSPPRSASWRPRTACSTRAPGRCSATSTRAR